MTDQTPDPPADLADRGREFWHRVVADVELNADEELILTSICRELDLLQRLEDEMAGAPLIVHGVAGQPVAHPMLQELRAHRALLAAHLRQLGLPDEDGVQTASTSARSLARARWGTKPR